MLTVKFDLSDIRPGERILDAGCGGGRHTFHLCKADCLVVAMDLLREDLLKVQYMVSLMDNRGQKSATCETLLADVNNLPFKTEAFHRIVCSEVLEHIPDDRRGLGELARTLKKGGKIGISVPTFFSEVLFGALSKEYFNTPGGHIRKYRAAQLTKLIKTQPLSIISIRHEHSFHTVYWLLRCIFGLHRESALFPRIYKKFLDWTLISNSFKKFDRTFNRIFPKSIVIYARKSS